MNTFPADNADVTDMRRLMKNSAANAAHGQGRVGRRVAPESMQQRFLIATTASRVFSSLFAPALRSFSEVGSIRVYSRLKDPIRTNKWA
jgi:hypothetical protein